MEKIISYLFSFIRNTCVFADKQYTKRDLQGRVNSFVKRLDKKMHSFVPVKMKIRFSTSNDLSGFESGNKYLIMTKREINPNTNFVNVVMFFLSKYLLLKAKKQISQKQQQSIDLFVAKELFKEEKTPAVMSEFVDSFLRPRTDDDKIRELFNKYTNFNKYGIFFPIFLQEMVFLGDKVFAELSSNKITEEVSMFVSFLDKYSQRKRGEETQENKFNGKFISLAIMIVGIYYKVESKNLSHYTEYVQTLINKDTESIYLIGDTKKKNFIINVGKQIEQNNDEYIIFKNESYPAKIRYGHDDSGKVESFLLVLRKKNLDPFIQNKEN